MSAVVGDIFEKWLHLAVFHLEGGVPTHSFPPLTRKSCMKPCRCKLREPLKIWYLFHLWLTTYYSIFRVSWVLIYSCLSSMPQRWTSSTGSWGVSVSRSRVQGTWAQYVSLGRLSATFSLSALIRYVCTVDYVEIFTGQNFAKPSYFCIAEKFGGINW